MGYTKILTAVEVHAPTHDGSGPTEADVRRKQAAKIGEMRARGVPVEVAERDERKAAFVNHGVWLVMSDCGSGAAVIPESERAYCLGCGDVYPVEMPPERTAIERALLKRPTMENRNWEPGESVADLRRENREHGVGE